LKKKQLFRFLNRLINISLKIEKMNPEKFISIMLLTLVLSSELEEEQSSCSTDRVDKE
jgi:hypothetical protein